MDEREVYVHLDSLRAHEQVVRGLAHDLGEAAQAIAQTTAPTFAYGILCSPILAGPMALVQQDGADGVAAVHDIMDAVAANLETTMCSYEFVDTSTRDGMNRFRSDPS
ncbi:type VII secretion target [Sanguibacter antarcticus]|uniref:Excreted virulence factor EspC (Type VII ESX diderm) n=1 Tax=Sanguibacter antarcticus TaxID=372484 RepID=A0A2A9E7Z2_9MICO|nr:type VII secretion target [Sanguibacter antarcticus]PFG34425.1 excreted virulence factor EspC (type VII ESX diderm) [Sanguibacter antarcticus]